MCWYLMSVSETTWNEKCMTASEQPLMASLLVFGLFKDKGFKDLTVISFISESFLPIIGIFATYMYCFEEKIYKLLCINHCIQMLSLAEQTAPLCASEDKC